MSQCKDKIKNEDPPHSSNLSKQCFENVDALKLVGKYRDQILNFIVLETRTELKKLFTTV